MNDATYQKIQALHECRLPPGTLDRQFIDLMAGLPKSTMVSDPQLKVLTSLTMKYQSWLNGEDQERPRLGEQKAP